MEWNPAGHTYYYEEREIISLVTAWQYSRHRQIHFIHISLPNFKTTRVEDKEETVKSFVESFYLPTTYVWLTVIITNARW